MLVFEIKHRATGTVLFSLKCWSFKACVEAACRSGVNLIGADLTGAKLTGANLTGANMVWANLSGADLRGAKLRGAKLTGAKLTGAKLTGANLTGAGLSGAGLSGANLRWADLTGTDLSGADLTVANLIGVPIIPNIHAAVYAAASQPGALEMRQWHSTCGTTHCRAGWVVTLAGEAGTALEKAIGTAAAATAIYLASDPNIGKFPDFYCDNNTALADMKARA